MTSAASCAAGMNPPAPALPKDVHDFIEQLASSVAFRALTPANADKAAELLRAYGVNPSYNEQEKRDA